VSGVESPVPSDSYDGGHDADQLPEGPTMNIILKSQIPGHKVWLESHPARYSCEFVVSVLSISQRSEFEEYASHEHKPPAPHARQVVSFGGNAPS
jgi:hypothetical protein